LLRGPATEALEVGECAQSGEENGREVFVVDFNLKGAVIGEVVEGGAELLGEGGPVVYSGGVGLGVLEGEDVEVGVKREEVEEEGGVAGDLDLEVDRLGNVWERR